MSVCKCVHGSETAERFAGVCHGAAAIFLIFESVVSATVLLFVKVISPFAASVLPPWIFTLINWTFGIGSIFPIVFALWHLWGIFEHSQAAQSAHDEKVIAIVSRSTIANVVSAAPAEIPRHLA